MSALHTWIRDHRRARFTARVAIVVVCLTLLALLTFIQVAHVHSVNTDADHCPLCIVIHTAAPMAAAAAVIVLVQLAALSPIFEVRRIGSTCYRHLFIRPPPRACPVLF